MNTASDCWRTLGSRSGSSYIRLWKPGDYRLLVHAVSGRGDSSSSERAHHALRIRVTSGSRMPHYFVAATVLSLGVLILAGVAYGSWKSDDDDDDDD